jgi:hypothetical protein
MHRLSAIVACISVCGVLLACGSRPEPPVTGADLVATAVAAHYGVDVDEVKKADGGYEWTVTAVNRSDYSWKGTFYVKLVNVEDEIVESHDFEMRDMVPPGGRTAGLRFTSQYAPTEMDGEISLVKAEVDVAGYEEPSESGAR